MAKEDKQDGRCYPKTGERPDRDWTGRPGRSPTSIDRFGLPLLRGVAVDTPAAPEASLRGRWCVGLLLLGRLLALGQ
jgi:hypothetical protein